MCGVVGWGTIWSLVCLVVCRVTADECNNATGMDPAQLILLCGDKLPSVSVDSGSENQGQLISVDELLNGTFAQYYAQANWIDGMFKNYNSLLQNYFAEDSAGR